ncbi:hypothetical protein PkoCFBP13504_14855 [Pseudomonas koreensis]|nr:hypothetical protein PkoCFBP13504_14855 [Pseudomonas koreensis]
MKNQLSVPDVGSTDRVKARTDFRRDKQVISVLTLCVGQKLMPLTVQLVLTTQWRVPLELDQQNAPLAGRPTEFNNQIWLDATARPKTHAGMADRRIRKRGLNNAPLPSQQALPKQSHSRGRQIIQRTHDQCSYFILFAHTFFTVFAMTEIAPVQMTFSMIKGM